MGTKHDKMWTTYIIHGMYCDIYTVLFCLCSADIFSGYMRYIYWYPLSWRSHDCLSASEATLMDMGKGTTRMSWGVKIIQNKTQHNNTRCIYHGMYSILIHDITRDPAEVTPELSSYPGYFHEPHWLSMGFPEISRVILTRVTALLHVTDIDHNYYNN